MSEKVRASTISMGKKSSSYQQKNDKKNSTIPYFRIDGSSLPQSGPPYTNLDGNSQIPSQTPQQTINRPQDAPTTYHDLSSTSSIPSHYSHGATFTQSSLHEKTFIQPTFSGFIPNHVGVVRAISDILHSKFDGPYPSWTRVPQDLKDLWVAEKSEMNSKLEEEIAEKNRLKRKLEQCMRKTDKLGKIMKHFFQQFGGSVSEMFSKDEDSL